MAGPISQMPMNVHPVPKADNTVAEQFIEQIEGETTFDQVAKAQSSMSQVVKRITELENCLWALAEQLARLDPRNPQIERAKLVLKNRLEILDSSKPLREGQAEGRRDALETLASLLHKARARATNTETEGGKNAANEGRQAGEDVGSPEGIPPQS